ncbi:uncharacterized protein MONOS_4789 [Monocercomonoides exilis]|uniref:uncharacterized protein n=1 Tax=Monocercomonoides exilis TaxID=2049356 RepID=UPI003559BF45|nr:hypothetical protein MONOS_4789 [Monocercomonoides exilis]
MKLALLPRHFPKKTHHRISESSIAHKFSKLFDELENCNEDSQKQKILEMNEVTEDMNEKEFLSVFTKELFDKINKMIEEKKISFQNALFLLKHTGRCNALKCMQISSFEDCSLRYLFEDMIAHENFSKNSDVGDRKDSLSEKDLADLCKSYIMLGSSVDGYFLCVCGVIS